MSDVFCFRLDKDNPREEKARQVLKAWYENGYSLRYIMTEALLKLEVANAAPVEDVVIEKVNEKLNRISWMLERIGNGQTLEAEKMKGEPTESELTAGFLGVIRQAAKPGMRCK